MLAQPPVEIGALDPADSEEPIVMLAKAAEFVPFTPPTNVTGQPAISLPLYHGDDGLPTGVQIFGQPAREDVLLSLGAQLESAQPWVERRPELD